MSKATPIVLLYDIEFSGFHMACIATYKIMRRTIQKAFAAINFRHLYM